MTQELKNTTTIRQPKLSIAFITACTRPENLATLHQSIIAPQSYVLIHKLYVDWYIVVDARAANVEDVYSLSGIGSIIPFASSIMNIHVINYLAAETTERAGGQAIKNAGLSLVTDPDTWVYFLDDDTILHPEFYREVKRHKEADVILGAQQIGHKIRYPLPKASHIDQGQYIIKRGTIGKDRIPENYCGDGEFIQHVVEKKRETPIRVDSTNTVIAIYNALRKE